MLNSLKTRPAINTLHITPVRDDFIVAPSADAWRQSAACRIPVITGMCLHCVREVCSQSLLSSASILNLSPGQECQKKYHLTTQPAQF